MKATLLRFALFIALATASHAVDIVTATDKYLNVKVTKVEAEGVRITHTEGTAFVDFDDLPPALQLESGWTPEKSAARKEAKAAEAKKIADEERMTEEAPKRKAEEEAAKQRAIDDKKRAVDLAAAKLDTEAALKDSLAEAAAARAEIDRERAGGKKGAPKAKAPPVAEVIAEAPAIVESKPRPGIAPTGSVAALLEEDKSWSFNRNVLIALGVASVIAVLLFFLPSSKSKVRVVTPARGKRK